MQTGYQYIQKSSLPMTYFQRSLPRLPIPALEKTCERYLNAQRPLLSQEEYTKTSNYVADFQKNQGTQLHAFLVDTDKANKHTSYISKPWFDMYLSDRAPLPINYNPFLTFKHDERKEYNDPVVRASNLVISSLRFMRSLRDEILEPEVFHLNPAKSDTDKYRRMMKLTPTFIATYVSYLYKAFPLDMSQYQGLFEATRIPEIGKDRIMRSSNSRHLAVLINGHPFTVDVLDENGNIEEPSVIKSRLQYVYKIGSEMPPSEFPIASLTTENRDVWAKLRAHLIKLGNGNAIHQIDSAIFCLSFDHDSYLDENNMVPMLKKQLYESTNHWFDKSFNLYVAKDGTATVNFEHSWGDGVAVLRYFNDVYKDSTEKDWVNPKTPTVANAEAAVKEIKLALDDVAKEGIKNAVAKHKTISDSIDLNFMYSSISRDQCKRDKASPDAVMQLAFQLAYFKQTQKFVASYESCSTAAFRHGRTETVRPCTDETRKFCEAISRGQTSMQDLRQMLDSCSAKHNLLTKDAAMGQGFDRHLFGLRHMADVNGIAQPDIFKDPNYAAINKNIVSTSTLSSPAVMAGGFGPVVQNGYGIGYNISNYLTGCIVANYKNKTNGSEFMECLKESFKQIEEVMKVKNEKKNN